MRHTFIFVLMVITVNSFSQTFEELCKQRVELEETPGIAVAIYENGKTTYLTFGLANIETKEAVTSKTLFEIGSITKTFTCTALANAVAKNEMGLEDNAQNYLPANVILPQKNGKQITLLHLASARSGLPRMPGNFSPADPRNPYVDYTEKELFNYLSNVELNAEPGAQYEYSNLGMGLLGYIIAKKRGVSYSKLIKETVLLPLDMRQTFISGERIEKLLAAGYTDKSKMSAWTWTDQSVLTGAGGIVSNAEDMIKYLVAQFNTTDPVLKKTVELARQERAAAGNLTYQIGLGWHLADHKYIWHNGGTGGFRSFAGFDPENKRAIVILTNSTNGADDLGFYWLNSVYPLKTLKKSIALEPDKLKEYEGVYEITPQFKITVTAEGSSLKAQATGQPQFSLYAEEVDKFFLKVVPAKINFGRDDAGKVVKLTLFQNGAVIEGKKN
ncbi:MAG: serine hydrolase [Bacteroidota bacterium]|jgi:D-alanyl-D-alanine-carboxypeptidase/D-alanyl-D-alanine-endopeptidase|nr:serine hydrolase [Cytophagales bacterium]MCE2956317.1 serine hydrolase [Flammeovirgaceae bacterium]MCZ8070575.1 serine hydrolase [Cytophagales bacterium]